MSHSYNPPPGPPQYPAGPGPAPGSTPGPLPGPGPAPKKSNTWKWVLGILGGLVLLCGGGVAACAVFVGTSVNEVVQQNEADERARAEGNKESCAGLTYADQQPDNDRCADAQGSVTLDEVTVTASALNQNQTGMCSNVNYSNNSQETVSFNALDWKLQLPTGEVRDWSDSPLTAGDELDSGDLVPGGTKTGTVCFEATAGPGQFVLIYKPSFWSDARGIWVNEF